MLISQPKNMTGKRTKKKNYIYKYDNEIQPKKQENHILGIACCFAESIVV